MSPDSAAVQELNEWNAQVGVGGQFMKYTVGQGRRAAQQWMCFLHKSRCWAWSPSPP